LDEIITIKEVFYMSKCTAIPPLAQQTFSFCVENKLTALDQAVSDQFGQPFMDGGYFVVDSHLPTFKQTGLPQIRPFIRQLGTKTKPIVLKKQVRLINGKLVLPDKGATYICPMCGKVLHGNGDATYDLYHLPLGDTYTKLQVSRPRLRCPGKDCPYNYTFEADFKVEGHMLTQQLEAFACDLLSQQMTLKDVAFITGLNQNVVKDIDKKRLEAKYTVNGEGKELIKPEKQSEFLGIDEFKLHNGRKYATVIIDLQTGHVLYLAHTKKKQVVYDFMDFVGEEWMKGVKAVSSDMNADYGDAFTERCPHIKVVYDHFHIVKNFNDNVVTKVRNEEIRRLTEEGDTEAANSLKGSKYVLMSNRETLEQKDKDAAEGKVLSKEGILFNGSEVTQKGGNLDWYRSIIRENDLLFTCDLVKEKLKFAYEADTELKMKRRINSIINTCESTGNRHFIWFANLLKNHYDGIIIHATYKISTGKVEGTNQMIKTLRRKSYGLPDDEYFFLKIMDASRR
jgi:transposase